jgi:hypothetical protein
MTTLNVGAAPSSGRAMLWTGWTLSGVVIAFMVFDTTLKLLDLPVVADASRQLGLPVELDRVIGVLELVSLVLYAWPRTAVLGAILLTAIFGGAIVSHLRLFDPLFSHTLFGVYLGLLAWGGLWFRSPALRRLLPLANPGV